MLRKKIDIKITSGRGVSDYMRRAVEAMERKFDGFPATYVGPTATPAIIEGSNDYSGFIDDIVDEIAANSGWATSVTTPPCPDGDAGNCIQEVFCVSDTFATRTTSPGDGWGDSDDGDHTWVTSSAGNNSTRVSGEFNAPLLSVAASTGSVNLGASQTISPTCAPSGVYGRILARWNVSASGASVWESSAAFNEANGSGGKHYAPSTTSDGSANVLSAQPGTVRAWVQIDASGTLNTYIRMFNADGQFWYTTADGNTNLYQKEPTLIGPAINDDDEVWVRMHTTSGGAMYANIWVGTRDDEPVGWMITETGHGWDGSISFSSTLITNSASYPTFSVAFYEAYVGATQFNCSGQTITERMFVTEGGGLYVTGQVKAFIGVNFDNLPAVKDIDYTETGDGGIITIEELDPDTVVTARYTML
jgi:hypothetical protein